MFKAVVVSVVMAGAAILAPSAASAASVPVAPAGGARVLVAITATKTAAGQELRITQMRDETILDGIFEAGDAELDRICNIAHGTNLCIRQLFGKFVTPIVLTGARAAKSAAKPSRRRSWVKESTAA